MHTVLFLKFAKNCPMAYSWCDIFRNDCTALHSTTRIHYVCSVFSAHCFWLECPQKAQWKDDIELTCGGAITLLQVAFLSVCWGGFMVTLSLGLLLFLGLSVNTFDQASLEPSSTGRRTLQTRNHIVTQNTQSLERVQLPTKCAKSPLMEVSLRAITRHHNYNPNAGVDWKSFYFSFSLM